MIQTRPNGRLNFHPHLRRPVPAPQRTSRRASPPSIDLMRLVPHGKGWALMIDDLPEPAWVVSAKRKGLSSARPAARFHACRLDVFTRAGKLQRSFDYGGAHAS